MNDIPESSSDDAMFGRGRVRTGPTDYHAPSHNRLGEVLTGANLLSEDQAQATQRYSDAHNMRFGEAAVQLGYIDQPTLQRALATQFDLKIGESGIVGEPVSYTDPHSASAEDYRSIRNALALRWFKHPQGAQTLAVVSPQRGDGRSVMAANLAVCFAQVGFRTLLVDADLRNPSQHLLFKTDNRHGLSAYLAGRVDEQASWEIPGLPTLSVMPAGAIPPNPQELMLRQMLHRLVEESRRHFEMVIFDTPAAESGSDYQIIGAEAVGALVVTRGERTRTRAARQMVDHCRDFGIRIVGSAMTGVN